jgi:universal stress protein A
MTITRILVPTDFSVHADVAMRYALELAERFNAQVHLLNIVEEPLAAGAWSSEIYTAEIAGLQLNLVRDAEKRLRALLPENAATVTCEVRRGPAARQILEAARERGSDLIVMGTRGLTGVAHVLMGSVAEKVVRLAPCPVLTLHAHEPAETAHRVA